MTRKIGVISDIHGNLPALQAVVAALRREGVCEIIHTGDVVDIGPHSAECLDLITAEGVTAVRGNHDVGYLDGNDKHLPLSHVSGRHKTHVFATLGAERKGVVASWPYLIFRQIGASKVAFVHYALLDEPKPNGYVFREIADHPTPEIFDEMFANVDADAVFFGHKHEPCDLVGKKIYCTVGSVGCHEEATANAVLIEEDGAKWTYRRLRVPYDRNSFKAEMTGGDLPDSQFLFDFYFDHLGDYFKR